MGAMPRAGLLPGVTEGMLLHKRTLVTGTDLSFSKPLRFSLFWSCEITL